MGQQEILNFLKATKRLYISAENMAKEMEKNVHSVRNALNRLYKQEEVEFIMGKNGLTQKPKRLWKLKNV